MLNIELTPDMKVYIILLAALICVVVLVLILRKFKTPRPPLVDELEGHDFEYYCADLLKMNGFAKVEVTKGSGDFGADILCERNGITYAIQCKCYDKDVGVHAVQEVYAAKDYYDRMVAAVLCNQYFTSPAAMMADKLNVMLWDRDYLDMLHANCNGK